MADLSMVFDLLARDRASSEVDKVGDSMGKAGDDADAFGDRVSGMMTGLAGAAAGAGLAVGAAFAGMLESEAASRLNAAQLGLDPAQQAAAGQAAGSIYAANYGDSLEGVNEALGAVMSSIDGLGDASSAATQAATQDALNFAAAYGTDVNESVASVGNLIRQGLVADAEQGFDLMTAAMQRVPAAMRGELGPILDEYGTNFAALGFTGEQAFGLLANAADGGAIVLDKTGDALKELTILGTDMSDSSVAAYEAIGLNADRTAAALLRGGADAQTATQQIAQGLLGIEDPVERANASIALFGTPLEDLGTAEIPAFLNALATVGPGMTDAAGASEELDATLAQGIGPRLETLKRGAQQAATEGMSAILAGFTQGNTDGAGWAGTLQNLAATLGSTLQPALEVVGGFLTGTVGPALSSVFGYLAENEGTVQVIAALIGGVLAAAFLVWGTRATIAAAQNVLAWFTTVSASTTGAATSRLSALQVIASWVLMGAQALLHGVKVATVWTVQTAIAGARTVAGWAVTAASTLASWALMGAQAAARAIAVGAVWLAQTAMTTGVVLAGWAVTVAAVVGGWVLMGVQSMIRAAMMAAAWLLAMGPVGWIIAAVIGLVALIIANWDRVKAFTVGAFQAIVGAVSGAFSSVVSAVSNGVSNAVNFVKELPGKIMSAVGNLGSLLVTAGGDLLRGLWNGISGSVSWLKNKIMDWAGSLLPGWVKDILGISSPSKVFADLGRWTMLGFAQGIDDGTGATLDAVESAMSAVSGVGADLTADVGVGGGGGLGYSTPSYDVPEGGAGAGASSSRTVHVSGVVGPEEVAALVRRDQATDEFLAGAGL